MISRHLAEHSIDGYERSLYELPHLANLIPQNSLHTQFYITYYIIRS